MNTLRSRHGWAAGLSVVLALTLFAESARAALFTSQAATTGDWSQASTWTNNAVPNNGDDVQITNAGSVVILSGATSNLNSLLLGRTLMFTNWNTTLTATNVAILTNGVITLPAAFTNNQMSNNIVIVCSNLTVAAGGSINVNGMGYAGGSGGPSWSWGSGPGGGAGGGYANGGGYGGHGGLGNGGGGGMSYGLPEAPAEAGSGGSFLGGAGGGLIRIEAVGAVQLDGLLSANGVSGTSTSGGGSGGGIFIQCKTVTGGGSLSANGGAGLSGGYGGGGGGRIAILYDVVAQSGVTLPTGVFSVAGGYGPLQNGDIGTLYFSDTRLLRPTMSYVGQLFSISNSWGVSSLLLTNSWLRFSQPGFRLTVTGDVVMAGTSRLDIGANAYWTNIYYSPYNASTSAPVFSVGSNVSLAAGCSMYLYGAHTNAATPNYGLLMSVTGNVSISNTAWIYPSSQVTNGGSPLLQMANLTVASGGGVKADQLGFGGGVASGAFGFGSGGGYRSVPNGYGGGGGYGGQGGANYASGGGATYGASNAPMYPGSGGGYSTFSVKNGGAGGGLIWIETPGIVQLNGLLSANGAPVANYAGGGSGGGIYIQCKNFSGSSSGQISANGGASTLGNGGGGGRIAIWRMWHQYQGSYSVTNGTGPNNNAKVGTVFLGQLSLPRGTILKIN